MRSFVPGPGGTRLIVGVIPPGESGSESSAEYAEKCGVTLGLEYLNRFECYLLNTAADGALVAEVAFTIEEDFQRQGLSHQLLALLDGIALFHPDPGHPS